MHDTRKVPPGERIIKIDELSQKIGLKKTSLYDLMARGKFPRPVKLTTQRRGWLLSEIEAWVLARRDERDSQLGGSRS